MITEIQSPLVSFQNYPQPFQTESFDFDDMDQGVEATGEMGTEPLDFSQDEISASLMNPTDSIEGIQFDAPDSFPGPEMLPMGSLSE